ncbi:hypothetical protein [Breznakia pachnodae]|uniref:Uncharacterized protein n=1 Tax=Breznakia pachnodae TaxID=265178 RepID=A0ABU0E0Z0_9FIRM|nr:hypothetical protein [Breznakia pachnodae]MDQ0360554.1 hypothetical protein [Breznakia pachnodae]
MKHEEMICLLKEWCDSLLVYQYNSEKMLSFDGAILCPCCTKVHGRIADLMYPLLVLQQSFPNEGYLDKAIALSKWEERMLSNEDGSYFNDRDKMWKGITVFTIIRYAHIIHYCSSSILEEYKKQWKKRLEKALEYLYMNIDTLGGNVNYTITASEALAWGWKLFHTQKYYDKSKSLYNEAMSYVNQEGLIIGEGSPRRVQTSRGCNAIDIGYNLEESLPALFMCAELLEDENMKEEIVKLFNHHKYFLLDDGGIDNSFGSRNYKWTYWGSKTAKGCNAVLLKIARQYTRPEYEIFVLRNLKLLKNATVNGLLQEGFSDGYDQTCIHMTFTQAMGLADLLVMNLSAKNITTNIHKHNTTSYFQTLNTMIINYCNWRATLTSYDYEYVKEGHTSGGCLSLLKHKTFGLIFVSSMNIYKPIESNNMYALRESSNTCMTPRLEITNKQNVYSQIYDYNALISKKESIITVKTVLTSINQEKGPSAIIRFIFEDKLKISILSEEDMDFIFPFVQINDSISQKENHLFIERNGVTLVAETNGVMSIDKNTIYNPVPGVYARRCKVMIKKNVETEISFSIS